MRLVSCPCDPCRPRFGKILIWLLAFLALGMFACCGSVGFFAMQSQKKKQETLAEADALYPSKPADAVAKYKQSYDAAGTRKTEVLQRIVDHEADAMNNAEAMKWIARGIDEKISPEYKSTLARVWYAKAQQDRADKEAAKKADEEAKRAEREAKAKQRDEEKGAKDQVKANKNLPRDQFRTLVSGRTEQQVLAALGKPDETQDQEGLGKLWYYKNTAIDPVTNKKSLLVQLVFEGGVVGTVNFN